MYRTSPQRCAEKVPYTASHVAVNAAEALGWLGLTLYPYECDVCGYWHLTHLEQVVDLRPVHERESVILSA